MNLNGRVQRLEKRIKPPPFDWIPDFINGANAGDFTAGDVLDWLGSGALEFFPQWYVDMPQQEKAARAAAADEANRVMFAPYSDAELQEIIDGRRPWPQGV